MKHLAGALTGFLWLWALPSAAQPSRWIGAAACGSCHPDEFRRQSAGEHAHSLYPATAHPLAARFAVDTPLSRAPGFHFSFFADEGKLRFRADDGKYVTEVPVEWAFGAGRQAVTFLSKVTPELHLELAFSYYADSGSFDITPRHETLRAATLHESMGQPIKMSTGGKQCFGCHSTGAVTISQAGDVQVAEAGVRCEACHGPGDAHRTAAERGDPAAAGRLIRNRGALDAVGVNQFCGTCHRVAGNLSDMDWNSPWSIRHQPPYLARSRCFLKSSGKLSCLTCHDAHDALRRNDAAYYRDRCSACHTTGKNPPARVCRAQSAPDCTACHMPSVHASAHLSFHNHQIGIYDDRAVLKPRR